MVTRRATLGLGLAGAMGTFPVGSQTRNGFPERPIRLVIPFSPGGPADFAGRRWGEALTRDLGQPVVVENKAGAAGALGAQDVIRSARDGHTLLLGTASTHVTTPATMPPPAYDPVRDFAHVAVVALVPIVMAVHPSVPARNLRELAELIRANPDRYPFGSAGVGTITHLAGEMFQLQAGGLKASHIPYRGSAPAMQDVIAGNVPWFVETFSTTLSQHREGRLRIVGVCSAQRSAIASEIGTGVEADLPELICNTFNIISGPAGVPEPVLKVLSDATGRLMQDRAVQAALRNSGAEPVLDSSPAAAQAFVRGEVARWAPVIAAVGLSSR